MTEPQKPDTRPFNVWLRERSRAHRVTWAPTINRDPADQRADRDALNQAIRRAANPDQEEEPVTPFPWKSLESEGT